MLSILSALAAGALWAYGLNIETGGNEIYGIRALMVSSFAVGSILAEVYFVLRYLFQKHMKGATKGKVIRMAALATALVWIFLALFLVYRYNNRGAVSPDLTLSKRETAYHLKGGNEDDTHSIHDFLRPHFRGPNRPIFDRKTEKGVFAFGCGCPCRLCGMALCIAQW